MSTSSYPDPPSQQSQSPPGQKKTQIMNIFFVKPLIHIVVLNLDECVHTSLAYPRLSSMMFSGLRSLQIIPLECRKARASTTQPVQNRVVLSSNDPLKGKGPTLRTSWSFRVENTDTHNRTPISQQCPQFSSKASLHQHVEIFGVSEGPIQSAGRETRVCLKV